MKRRILSILTALCLALTLLPTAAFAVEGEGQETHVGGASGKTLEAAAASATAGDTLVLDSDVEITAQVTIPAGVHLNGQGHTISVGSNTWSTAYDAKYMLVCGSDTNVKNVTIDAENIASGCLQFYKATNSWVLGPVTLKNAKEMGLMVNASPSVSVSGALNYEGNGWGNTINVGWGSGVTGVDTCSFTAGNATMTGVTAIYTDNSDVTNAGDDSSKFTIDPPQGFAQVTGDDLTQTGLAICYVPSAPVTDGVAEVNGQQYKTLAEAIEKAPGGATVTLLKNVALSDTLRIQKKTITLDLNGCVITAIGTAAGVEIGATADGDVNAADVTLKDSKTGGAIQSPAGFTKALVCVRAGSSMTMESGMVNMTNADDENASGAVQTQGRLTINGGTISSDFAGITVVGPQAVLTISGGTVSGNAYGVSGNGTASWAGTTITITGGTITQTGNGGGAIYHPQDGTLNISGNPIISGDSGIQLCSGEGVIANITGGTITATGDDERANKTGDGFIPDGAAISVVNRNYPGGTPKMNISGGTFTSNASSAVLAYTWSSNQASNWEQAGEYLTITGGTFSSEPDAAYIPTGYEVSGEGPYQVIPAPNGALVVTPDVEKDGSVTGTLDGVYRGASTGVSVDKDETDETTPDGGGTTNTAGNLVVNLETPEGQTDATSTTLTVETGAAQSLGKNKAQSLTLVTDAGSVKLGSNALSKMETVTAPVEITVASNTTEVKGDVAASYTVSVQSDGKDLLPYGDASNGIVEITVDKPAGDDLQAWYAVEQSGGSVLYMEKLPTDAESVEGKLVIRIRHLSRVDVLKGAPKNTGVAMIGDTAYASLKAAIDAVSGSDETVITLTQSIDTLEKLVGTNHTDEKTTLLSIGADKNITIQGNTHEITIAIPENFDDRGEAIQVNKGATLTLDGVDLTITRDTSDGRGGDAFDLFGNLVITNTSDITVTGVQNAFVMQGGTAAQVTVENGSTVTATDVRGNFSNGGIWNLTNATLDINGCESYGLSVNNAEIKNSKVDINGVKYAAIIVTNIVKNGTQAHEGRLDVYNSQIAITNSGKKLPRTDSPYGKAVAVIDLGHASGGSQYTSGSDIPNAAACLNVTGNSSITVDDTKGVNGAKVNHIYLTNTADLERDNTSTLPNVVMERPTADSNMCTVEFLADGVLYQAKQVKVTNGKTDPFGVPNDAPAKNGHTFAGWVAPSGMTEETASDGGTILSTAKAGNVYVYTARYQLIPVTPTEPDTPSYSGGSSSGETTYSPSLDVSSGGTIKVSPRTPEAGETVTITPMPEAGYDVGTVTVTDRNGKEVKVTEQRNSTYIFEQPAGRVTIEVTFVRTGEIVGETPFLDVAPDAWYADAVAYVYENGLMSGTSATAFSPNATTTRGMIVTMLYRLEGEPDVNFGSSFNDVDSTMYYADAVAWASQNGIVTGYDETSFGPNDAITREQMAAILYRYAQYRGYDTAQGGMAIREYDDYAEISEYAQSAMGWAVSEGLVTGTSSTTLTPEGSAVRAQVAAIFMRFMEGRGGVKIQ